MVFELAHEEGADLAATCFDAICVAQLPRMRFNYIAYGTKQRLSHVAANSCAP